MTPFYLHRSERVPSTEAGEAEIMNNQCLIIILFFIWLP